MGDILCTLMGIADIIAGILIISQFNLYTIAVVFGIIMIVKGVFSFL